MSLPELLSKRKGFQFSEDTIMFTSTENISSNSNKLMIREIEKDNTIINPK